MKNNIKSCAYSIDSGYVEVKFSNDKLRNVENIKMPCRDYSLQGGCALVNY